MAQPDNPRAIIGGNAPPDPLLAEAAERAESANRWLTERNDVSQWDDEIADKANFFISQVDATFKALNDRRLQEGRDFKAEQERVYKQPLDLLALAKSKLGMLRTRFLQAKQAKIDADKAAADAEAKRLADEAEAARKKAETSKNPLEAEIAAQKAQEKAEAAAEAAMAAPTRATITGTFSPRAKGLTRYWDARITDFKKAFVHYKADPVVVAAIKEAMQRCAKRDAVAAKDKGLAPSGVEFYYEDR